MRRMWTEMNRRTSCLCPSASSAMWRPTHFIAKGFASTPVRSNSTLDELANTNHILRSALDMFNSNRVDEALSLSLEAYANEMSECDPRAVLTTSLPCNESTRPSYTFLSMLLSSLGPSHPGVISTLAEMQAMGDEATPFKPRVVQKQHGGYPVRLNNGKWTWQGPHWSRKNNRTWKSGFSSDFTYGMGK